jgi:hypothetical protein
MKMEIIISANHGHKIKFRETTNEFVELSIKLSNGQPATPEPFFIPVADLEHGVGGLCKAIRAKSK